jgi:hypothetical protein
VVLAEGPTWSEPGEDKDPLLAGDRLTSVADPREELLRVTRLSLECDTVEVRVERAGQPLTLTVDRVHLVRHLRLLSWNSGGAKTLAALEVSGDAASLDRLPGRVLQHLVAGGRAPWVGRAVATWLALDAGAALPPAGEPAADAFIARCEAMWRKAGDGDPVPDPWAWGVEPEFAALYLPYPAAPAPAPALGTLALSDHAFQACFTAALDQAPEVSLQARRAQAYANVAEGEGTEGFLGQVKAAILDEQKHGGWPFRSGLIWEASDRATILTELRARRAQGGVDRPLIDYALVGPLVMENAGDELAAVVEELRGDSPLLARRAFVLADSAAHMHRNGKAAFAQLEALDRTKPFLQRPARMAFYRRLAERTYLLGYTPFADYDQRHGHPANLRTHPAEVADALSPWWNVPSKQAKEQQRLISRLNHVAWSVAVDPQVADGPAALELASQMRHVAGRGMPAFALDTVAACLARGGDFATAARYQQNAIAHDQRNKDEFVARLALYAKREVYSEEATPGERHHERSTWPDGTRQLEGDKFVVANQRFGWWRSYSATGVLTEEQQFLADQPTGVVRRYHPDGRLRESGVLFNGNKVGRWRTFDLNGQQLSEQWWLGDQPEVRTGWSTMWHPSGKPAEAGPWIGGRQDGFWQAWRVDGSPVSAGVFDQGEPTGSWRTWNAAGVASDRTAAGAADTF